MKVKLLLISVILLFCTLSNASSKEWKSSVAIVTDEETYNYVSSEIDNYMKSINRTGKNTYLIIDRWGLENPLYIAPLYQTKLPF